IGELRAKSTGQTVYRDQIKREFGPGKVIGRGGKIEVDDEFSRPLYEGQEPAGRMRVEGYEPLEIYLPDDVSRGMEQLRGGARLEKEALDLAVKSRYGDQATADDVAVFTQEEAVRRA